MSIGQPIPRIDGRDKVTGQARYAADHSAQGVLHGALVDATIPAGRVQDIDVSQALAHPGVERVLTHADMPRFGTPPIPPVASTFLPLQSDEIHYQGQPLAIVLATSLESAAHAANLVVVRHEAAPFHADAGSSDLTGAELPAAGGAYLFGTPVTFSKGDFAREFGSAPIRQETTYIQPARHHNPMETSAVIADWDGERLTLHDAVQAGFTVRAALAAILKLESERIRVISPHTGGGFGAKGFVWPHEIIAAAAAIIMRRRVRIQLTRAQQYSMVGYQARTVQTVSLGAASDGRLLAIKHDSANITGVDDEYIEISTEASRSMYAAPAIETRQRVMPRHVNLPTPMRAPVEGVGMWAIESAMNELAHRVGMDPLDLRLRNHADVDPADGKPWSSKKLREAYDDGARLFGWRERPRAPVSDGPWLVGYGMASCTMGCFRNPWKVRVTLRADGRALVETGFHDIGTGTPTVIPQIAADALGLDVMAVTAVGGDTLLPEAGPSYGSSSVMGAGGAILDAVEKIRQRLAEVSKLPVKELQLRDGGIGRRDAPVQPIGQVLRAAGVGEISADGLFAPDQNSPYAMRTFGAVFVEVGVDPDFGLLRLRRAVGSYSAGRIVNLRTARSQIIGGIIWGWGKATLEESRYEPKLGRWFAKNLSNVAIPVNADIPGDIQVHFVDEFDPHASPIGGKGIGELAATGVDAAIADAVFHATGKRIRELPITPEKLLASS